MRVPGIAWMPGRVKPGLSSDPVGTLDLLPTFLSMTGSEPPADVLLDGIDLSPLLFEGRNLPDRPFFFYRGSELYACRIGEWKAHFKTRSAYGKDPMVPHEPPLLYHLGIDTGERRNLAAEHPEILEKIAEAVRVHREKLVPGEPQFD